MSDFTCPSEIRCFYPIVIFFIIRNANCIATLENVQRSGIDTIKYHIRTLAIWESDKNTRKHHIPESQEVSPFPAGDHKAARNREDSMT